MKAGMVAPHVTAFLQVNFLELVKTGDIVPNVVMGVLALASLVFLDRDPV